MRIGTVAAALGLALVMAGPAAAQGHEGHGAVSEGMHAAPPSEGLRAELIQDIEQVESKYLGLARAMAGKYDWRPGENVRSVGEVFAHVAQANFMIPGMVGVEAAMAGDMSDLARRSEADITQALEHSFRHARHAIADVPDGELDAMVMMFGRDATKRQVLTLLVTHMHEHLGQSIAYARTNGVTPPWSAGS